MAKPKFNPNESFEILEKPKFDPNTSFEEVQEVSELESGARGFGQGVSLGFSDEITGGVEALWEKAKGNPEEFGRLYSKSRDEARLNNNSAREANPFTYGAGEVGGSISTALVPGLNIAKGATVAGRVAQAAALGGASGLGTSNEDNIVGLVKDTAIGGAMGGVFQGLGEKIIGPVIKKAGNVTDKIAQAINPAEDGFINRGISKLGSLATGVDEDAALRQIQRPNQMIAAQSEDFAHHLGQQAISDTEDLGKKLSAEGHKASAQFLKDNGQTVFKSAQELPGKIDDFLLANKPSAKGFSGLADSERKELEKMAEVLRNGNTNGEDLYKFRKYLDHVENLAGKYDQEGKGPFIGFLKSLRHDADSIIDKFDPNFDSANRNMKRFLDDKNMLRGASNESQAEGMVNNLYGQNKKAKQEAATNLFKPSTMEQAKDIAANKAFTNAKGPAGSEFGLRRIGGLLGAIPGENFFLVETASGRSV